MPSDQKKLGSFSGNQRACIRMSKIARALQSAAAETNWHEMVKMLFWADPQAGRQVEIRKLISEQEDSCASAAGASYSPEQFRYILILMLIISIAEKKTQELYSRVFAERCDAIGKDHALLDDQYWPDGNVPAEWENLNAEFEEHSLRILLETLREYHLDEIADLVQVKGFEQLFRIIEDIKPQFLNVLVNSAPAKSSGIGDEDGSIPETLQSLVQAPKV